MYDMKYLEDKLKTMLTQRRYVHSLGVRDTAARLAEIHGISVEKAMVAGLMHDCAKDFPVDQFIPFCSKFNVPLDAMHRKEVKLIHAPLGAAICEQEFGIKDDDILEAITYHTLAKPDMSALAKIIYLADFIEPSRAEFCGLKELSDLCFHSDLDSAMIFALDLSIKMVVDEHKRIHYFTVDARNYFIDLNAKR